MSVLRNARTQVFEQLSYVWLEGDMGYVFLEPATVKMSREPRSRGTTYFNMAIEHGIYPTNESYAYMMLPNATLNETALVAQESGVEILFATDDMHAVKDMTTGKIYVNSFSQMQQMGDVLINTPCSLILKPLDNQNGYVVYISDPTTENSKLSLQFDKDISSHEGEYITVQDNVVTVDISNDRSAIYEFTVHFY